MPQRGINSRYRQNTNSAATRYTPHMSGTAARSTIKSNAVRIQAQTTFNTDISERRSLGYYETIQLDSTLRHAFKIGPLTFMATPTDDTFYLPIELFASVKPDDEEKTYEYDSNEQQYKNDDGGAVLDATLVTFTFTSNNNLYISDANTYAEIETDGTIRIFTAMRGRIVSAAGTVFRPVRVADGRIQGAKVSVRDGAKVSVRDGAKATTDEMGIALMNIGIYAAVAALSSLGPAAIEARGGSDENGVANEVTMTADITSDSVTTITTVYQMVKKKIQTCQKQKQKQKQELY